MDQLKLPLQKRITIGKKNQRLSIPCSDEFLDLVDRLAELLGMTRAEFGFEAVLKHIQEKTGEVFLAELHGDKRVSEFFD